MSINLAHMLPFWPVDGPSEPSFASTRLAAFLLSEESGRAIQSRSQLRQLSSPYEDTLLSSGPGVLTAQATTSTGPDFVFQQGDHIVAVEAKSTVRAAAALHDLNKVSSQFQELYTSLAPIDQLCQRAGRSNRSSDRVLWMAAGSGKTNVLTSLVWRLTRALKPSSALSFGDIERITSAIDNALEAEVARSSGKLSWRRTVYLLSVAAGLARTEARNLGPLLLRLVSLRSGVFARRHNELNAVGSRGRVYLRTALRGSSTLNAPPSLGDVRTLRRTGLPSLPPMSLAA